MNKFFAALMTLIILITVIVVFGLGVMSLDGMSSGGPVTHHENDSPAIKQGVRQ